MTQGEFYVIYKRAQNGLCDMVIDAPPIVDKAQIGQFVHVKCQGFTLRRPISIAGFEPSTGRLRLVFEVRGEGTQWLYDHTKVGDALDIMGPLGHGFALLENTQKALIVGGGIGTPPLLGLANHYAGNAHVVLGFQNIQKVILEQDYTKTGASVTVCTDDGSYGTKGFVTQPVQDLLEKEHFDIVYACGPSPMLKAVAQLAGQKGVRCQVSLEERMGCGVGACLVCACKTQKAGKEHFSHVCKDGPVFEAEEVCW